MNKTKCQDITYCLEIDEAKNSISSFARGAKRIFLVHGHSSYIVCGAKILFDQLAVTLGWDLVEFEDFSQNPKKDDVDAGVELLLRQIPDVVIAVGGGSVLDMAKLIRHYAGLKLPLLAIPTTAGTGAESTQFAVCYIDGIKHSISDVTILPDSVILYPQLTYCNNRYLTSCTGFDALAQAIEAYWNINATSESDKYALEAIDAIYPLLLKENLTPDERASILKGANNAGKAINITKTTVPHALSYVLTSKYGYPHGHAVALTFPFFFKYNKDGGKAVYKGKDYKQHIAKMNRLYALMGIRDDPYMAMKRYISQLGLAFNPMKDFDDATVIRGINLERAKNTPIAIDENIISDAVKSIRE